MKKQTDLFPHRWWIVKLFMFAEKIVPLPMILSTLLFALPLSVAGVWVSIQSGASIFIRGVIFGLIWLSMGPWLLTLAYRAVFSFFDDNRAKFLMEDEEFTSLKHSMLKDLGSPMYLFIAVPLVSVAVWGLLNTVYLSSILLVKIWAGVTFGLIFYFGSMGFWGISRFNYIFDQVCRQKLYFDPYHADSFGGLSFLGQFNIKGPQYFFTGALLFPMAFETLNYLPSNDIISLAYWAVLMLYAALGIAGFIVPQIKIKDLIANQKNIALSKSEDALQLLLKNLCIDRCDDKEQADVVKLKIDVYYQYFHNRILAVKEWPFDWKTILQIMSSLAIPLAVGLLEIFLK